MPQRGALAARHCRAVLAAGARLAAEGLDGAEMSMLWALPFAGLLLSIATGPVLYPHVWEHHYGKFAAFWAACVHRAAVLFAGAIRPRRMRCSHTMLLEYMPFILLLLALFTVAGGIYLEGNLRGTPAANVLLLWPGTAARKPRRHHRRLDDPDPAAHPRQRRPRLQRPYRHLLHLPGLEYRRLADAARRPAAVRRLPQGRRFLLDARRISVEDDAARRRHRCWRSSSSSTGICTSAKRAMHHPLDPTPDSPLRLHGMVNFALIGVIIAAILMSAYWKPGISFTIFGVEIELQNIVRDAIFVAGGCSPR